MDLQTSSWAYWIQSVLLTGALAFIWFDMRSSKKNQRSEYTKFQTKIEKRFEELLKDFKQALYGHDGTTRYVPRGECENQSVKCQTMLCGKIEELKVVQKDADKKREDAREVNREQMEKISKHMGQVERYMVDHP